MLKFEAANDSLLLLKRCWGGVKSIHSAAAVCAYVCVATALSAGMRTICQGQKGSMVFVTPTPRTTEVVVCADFHFSIHLPGF